MLVYDFARPTLGLLASRPSSPAPDAGVEGLPQTHRRNENYGIGMESDAGRPSQPRAHRYVAGASKEATTEQTMRRGSPDGRETRGQLHAF